MPELVRVVIMLPEDKYQEFKRIADDEYEPMSSIGRKLILRWLEERAADISANRPPQQGEGGDAARRE